MSDSTDDATNPLPIEHFDSSDETNEKLLTPGSPSVDLLVNVPMRISVELGRTRMPFKNILQLSHGSVIELNRAVGEPLTIYINGEIFAYGEAVLVNQERFGVRLTALVNKEDLIQNPREP